jgi:WXXGXW repeat (2 copies)
MSVIRLAGLSLLACALSGCIVLPPRGGGHAHGAYQGGGYEGEGYGDGPPVVGYVWIDGFWDWQLGRRVWIGGRWGPLRGGPGRR